MKAAELGGDERAIQQAKAEAERAQRNWMREQRIERAAMQIFAAMQANPHWTGSQHEESRAVEMAVRLIDAIDREFSAGSGE